MRSANEDGLSSGPGKGRIEALSDGAFAIAMTLLVLDLKPPRIEPGRESVGDGKGDITDYRVSFWADGDRKRDVTE